MGIILAILLFSLIIIIHELGHFTLAKLNGIRVDEFSLGMGPTLVGREFKGTKFSLKLLPLGGACMMGEDDADDQSEGSFNSKSVWARISVIAAGPVFNFILALLMSAILVGAAGYAVPVIQEVEPGSSGSEQGLKKGDVITQINGKNIHIYEEFQLYNLTHSKEDTAELTFERDEKRTDDPDGKDSFKMKRQKNGIYLFCQMWRNRAFSKASSMGHTRQNTG